MIVLLIFTLICVGANMAMMLMKQDIMDNAMGSAAAADGAFDAADYGFFVLFFYCLLMIIYTLFSIMKTRSVSSASRKISAGSGSLLFKKIFRQPLRFFEQYSGYELISRIENNITIDNSILKTLVPRVIDAGMSILYLVLLFYYNAIISAVCVVLVILTLLASYRIQRKHAIASKSMTTSSNIVNASLLNGINMIDTIQSVGAERSFYNIWRRSQAQFNRYQKLQSKFSAAASDPYSSLAGSFPAPSRKTLLLAMKKAPTRKK